MQRRVFWVAYNLDRIAAISTGRPFGIAEEDIDVEVRGCGLVVSCPELLSRQC